jgi:hypothetical protein
MNHPFYNDQAYIAESFNMSEDYLVQSARLAFFKINSYKLSLIKSSFCQSREELQENLRTSLFNYTENGTILSGIGFFVSEQDN